MLFVPGTNFFLFGNVCRHECRRGQFFFPYQLQKLCIQPKQCIVREHINNINNLIHENHYYTFEKHKNINKFNNNNNNENIN